MISTVGLPIVESLHEVLYKYEANMKLKLARDIPKIDQR